MSETDIPLSFAKSKERPLMVMGLAEGDEPSGAEDTRAHRLERLAEQAHWQLLSFHKGRIVRRVDNGLMMEFADARSCLQAAFALGQLADSATPHLRAAAHLASYSQGQDEFAGQDVTLTSGLTSLAKPGEVLVTAELRDRLADGLDADFEDLGDQRTESSTRPVRLFRARPRQAEAADWSAAASRDLRPGLAVIPFEGGIQDASHWMIGELIAEGVIARLSHSIGIRVISRHSTSALRDRGGLGEIERYLGAAFVLSGSYSVRGKKIVVKAELAEARSHTLLWSGELQHAVGDLLQEESALLYQLAYTVSQALGKSQVGKALAQPLPRLDSSFLMLAGISMTHSHSAKTFERGRLALTELTERHPRLALPRAWLGMWYALNVVKGQSGDAGGDTMRARDQTMRALQAEPNNPMALAVEGYIQCQLLGNAQQSRSYLNAAIEANPSEPMAWLFKSFSSAMWGSSSASVTEAYIARSLSPVDPLRYFFDLLTGNALLADRRHEQAIACAQRSLKANKHHVPTLRLLMAAQAELGRLEEAKETLGRLLAEVPGLTVASYLGMGSTDSPMRQRIAAAMRQLGLPEGGVIRAAEQAAKPRSRGGRARQALP
ncbi:MAG: tetratricopeptide repeat protein [Pseudomonadota bacterium]